MTDKKFETNNRLSTTLRQPRMIQGVPCYLLWTRMSPNAEITLRAIRLKEVGGYKECSICGFFYTDNAAAKRVDYCCSVCEMFLEYNQQKTPVPYFILLCMALRGATPVTVTSL